MDTFISVYFLLLVVTVHLKCTVSEDLPPLADVDDLARLVQQPNPTSEPSLGQTSYNESQSQNVAQYLQPSMTGVVKDGTDGSPVSNVDNPNVSQTTLTGDGQPSLFIDSESETQQDDGGQSNPANTDLSAVSSQSDAVIVDEDTAGGAPGFSLNEDDDKSDETFDEGNDKEFMNYAENKDVNDEISPLGRIGSDDDDDDENYDGAKWTHGNSDDTGISDTEFMNYAENKDVNDETSPPGQIGSDDDDDENYDGAKWTHSNSDTEWDERVEDDNGDEASEASDQLLDDFNGEQFKKDKPPTAPSSMVVFYTWMIVAIFISIVAFSMYQSRCKGFRFASTRSSPPGSDRKRLLDHEFV